MKINETIPKIIYNISVETINEINNAVKLQQEFEAGMCKICEINLIEIEEDEAMDKMDNKDRRFTVVGCGEFWMTDGEYSVSKYKLGTICTEQELREGFSASLETWDGELKKLNNLMSQHIQGSGFIQFELISKQFTTLEMIQDWIDSDYKNEYRLINRALDYIYYEVGSDETAMNYLCWKSNGNRQFIVNEDTLEYMWFKVEEDKPEFIKFEDWEDGVWYCANGCNREKENFAYKIENNIIYIKILDDTDPPLIRSSISYNELHDIDWIKWEGK